MNDTTFQKDLDKRKNNDKVPIAILSCFLIAFIVQGILKISGIFVFEKALDWEIFKIIDKIPLLRISYYAIISILSVYCLTFSLTSKPYSNRWYHYLMLIGLVSLITVCRMLVVTPFYMEFVYDICLYIIIPLLINFTTDRQYRMSKSPIITIALQIMLYFVYLGLAYWSNLLASLLPITQTTLPASVHFLIKFEMYIGLVTLMLSMNLFIKKEEIKMNWPTDIATDEAKEKELEEVEAKKEEKEEKK